MDVTTLLRPPKSVAIDLGLFPRRPASKAEERVRRREACAEVRRAINRWLYEHGERP